MTNDEIEVLLSPAENARNKGDYADAERLADEVRNSVYSTVSPEDKRRLDAQLAVFHASISFRRGDYEHSIEQNTIALMESEAIGDRATVARVNIGFGNAHARLGNTTTALEYFEKALAAFEQLQDSSSVARALVNIGSVHAIMSNSNVSIEYYQKALSVYKTLGDRSSIALVTGNIGTAYAKLSRFEKASECFLEALAVHQELGEKPQIAMANFNLAMLYYSLDRYDKALETIDSVRAMNVELGEKHKVANSFRTTANIYTKTKRFDKAVESFTIALGMFEELGQKAEAADTRGELAMSYAWAGMRDNALEHYARASSDLEELGWTLRSAVYRGRIGSILSDREYKGYDPLQAEELMLRAIDELGATGSVHDIMVWHENLASLYEHQNRTAEAFAHYKKYIEIERQINLDEVSKQQAAREQQNLLEAARTRALERESILNNVLPEEITARLIKGEKPIADHFDCVSVLFMDIVDFTPLAATITASQVVHLLNAIFSSADEVTREFGLEKIKTIGDAYMAVAGAPAVQKDHAMRAAMAALKLLEAMNNLVVSFPESYGDRSWIQNVPEIQVRIGLHCGPAAAGVVGENKFLYDLWGDAVNTAARMESYGQPGRVHVSEEFMREVQVQAGGLNELLFEARGEMEIKGKGMMRTYFLEQP